MKLTAITLAATLAMAPALAEAPTDTPAAPPAAPGDTPAPAPVWTKTKIVVCEVLGVQNCRSGGCEPGAKLPSFRIDIAQRSLCGLVSGGCRNAIKIGQLGLDRTGTRLTVHALGVAFVVGIDADGAMTGADVVRGRVVAIRGRCVPG